MRHIVIGMGEIGSAIQSIFGADYTDPVKGSSFGSSGYDMMHICIPYGKNFENIVKDYQKEYQPTYTVVHSTVPIGTCNKLDVTHSPCRGKHPSLKESILTFTKYVGGTHADIVTEEFVKYGIPAQAGVSARDTEAGKLIDLMQLGAMVLLEKEIYSFCEENFLDYNLIYDDFNRTYNTGYQTLGQGRFTRPVYEHMEGKIGGHCVIQNMPSLDMETAEFILEKNAEL